MQKISLRNCRDCDVEPGQIHHPGCNVERCSHCGKQAIKCGHHSHDPTFARWTGIWPGELECRALGLLSYWDPAGKGRPEVAYGHIPCSADHPGAGCDLNRFYDMGLHHIFFVKPVSHPEFETFRFADISTCHITEGDGARLQDAKAPFRLAASDPVHGPGDVPGAMFWVPPKDDVSLQELVDYGFSSTFVDIFRRLQDQGIPYVRFDRDGGAVKDLPEFEW